MFRASFSRLARVVVPIGDRVLVKRVGVKTETDSGILIPEKSQKRANEAEVVEVGAGTKDYKMTVKKGDKVLLGDWAGSSIKLGGEDYHIVREQELLALFRE